MLQKSGGLFQLLADLDFGTAFGVKSLYYKTRTANIADAGQIRLARADVISFRNQANSGNLDLGVSASDVLQFNGADLMSTALTTNHILVGSAGGIATDVAMSGDATIIASGALTIAANVVTNAKLAQIATATLKGRVTAGTGDVEDLTGTQATSLLDAFVGDSGSGGTKGLVPAPAAGDAAANKFLKANGSWANLSGDVSGPGSSTDNALVRFDSTTGKIIQNSLAVLTDGGNLSGIVDMAMTGALSGCTALSVDNITIDGNVISSTNSNGNIDLTPNGTGQIRSQKRHLFNAPAQFGETIDTLTTGPDVSLPATSNIKYQNVALTEIRSIGAGSSGNYLILTNDTGGDTVLKNEDSGATAANRIITGTGDDLSMSDNSTVILYYDSESTRWRVAGGSGGGAPSAANYQVSSAVSSQNITSGSPTDVTNLSVTITTSGKPVMVMLVASGSGTGTIQLTQTTVSAFGKIYFVRDATTVSIQEAGTAASPGPTLTQSEFPPSSFQHFDPVAAGTYTYKVQASIAGSSGQAIYFDAIKLVAYELLTPATTIAPTVANEVISSSSGSFSTTSGTYVDVTSLSVSITTNGGRIIGILQPLSGGDNQSNIRLFRSATVASGYLALNRGGAVVSSCNLRNFDSGSGADGVFPPGSVSWTEKPSAGTYTYKVQAFTDNGAELDVNNCVLLVYEL